MIPGQTGIAPCAWCGDCGEGEVEIERAKAGTERKNYRDARPARTVPACARHMAIPGAKPSSPRRQKPTDKQLQLSWQL